MANGTGAATLDFGAAPGSNEASVAVTGLATISATSKADAFVMGDDTTADHTAADHRYLAALVGLARGSAAIGAGSASKLDDATGEAVGMAMAGGSSSAQLEAVTGEASGEVSNVVTLRQRQGRRYDRDLMVSGWR